MRFLSSRRRMLLLVLVGASYLHAEQPKPPGQLLDLGGYKLHLWCTGTGTPTVVLSAGSGDFSFDWSLLQARLARDTRVCSYDRGGEAWSDLGPRPRTAVQEVADLRRLLLAASIPGPYVLIGHSLGGFIATLYASKYPGDLSALVLIDSTAWNSLMNINGKVAPLTDFSKNRTIPAPRSHSEDSDKLSADEIKGIQDFVKQSEIVPAIEAPFDKLPQAAQQWRLWALAQTSHWAATQDDYFGEEAQMLAQWAAKPGAPLGDLSLVVLSRQTPAKPTDLDEDHEIRQHELAALSRHGKIIFVPGSGHHIQLDQPEAVVSAIKALLTQLRRSPASGAAPLP